MHNDTVFREIIIMIQIQKHIADTDIDAIRLGFRV